MKDQDTTEDELAELRQRIAELEKSEIQCEQAMENLRESENKYRVLLENLPQKIFYNSTNNNNYARNLNIKHVRDGQETIVHPVIFWGWGITECKRMEEALQRAHDELEVRVLERTSELAKTNEILQAEIAEHRRTEEKLRLFLKVVEEAPDGVQIVDLDGHILYSNKAVEEIYGFSAEEYRGKHVNEMNVDPEFAGRVILPSVKETGRWVGELMVKHKDGRVFPIWLTTSVVRDSKAEPTAIVAIIRDITEHKLANEKIQEQAALLDKAQDAIIVRDMENRITYWNKSAQRLYGWTMEEATGKNANELLYKDKEEQQKLIEAQMCVIEKGDWIGELRQRTKDSKEIVVESRWTLVSESSEKPKSILIINTDITEKKMLEAQLLRAQRMESIGTFASGIAHDLNNKLTPIMLSLQILQERFKDEQSQKLLNILEISTQCGANLIKQVMSFTRGIEGERVALQVSHFISEIMKIANQTFPRSIEIRTDIKKDLFPICGDAAQLHQVLMNLCVNALDAMPDGGILSISAENIFIDENYARMNIDAKVGPYIVITFSDTGTGVPPEILDRIFEPFFTTKEHGKGTGLGLSTALTIVKSHGGFINAHSEVGKGTTFKVYLPAIKTETQKAEVQQQQLPVGHGESILIVDDEATIREITQATLETNGYRVITASDGAEAAALYAQKRDEIKVVLMDMAMPIMDGPTSIWALRKINPQVKIIAVSGLTDKDKLANVADHVHAFLRKPYTAEKLLRTIHEVISAK